MRLFTAARKHQISRQGSKVVDMAAGDFGILFLFRLVGQFRNLNLLSALTRDAGMNAPSLSALLSSPRHEQSASVCDEPDVGARVDGRDTRFGTAWALV